MVAKKFGLAGSLALLMLAALVVAQEPAAKKDATKKAPAAKSASKMLLPDWKPSKGTYEEPSTTLGEKPTAPWTDTTIGAAVDKKPLAGKTTTVRGEVIDYSCYLQLGKHGDKHKACGTKCIQAGQPIGLLTKDGSIYLLMAEEHDPRRDGQTADLRSAAVDHFAEVVEVTGTETRVDGQKAIYVQGFVKK